jgi:LysR family nitrogen assimilation transcriptional regulator
VSLRTLAELPLVLPTRLFGLRQLAEAAARGEGLSLRPRHEVDSLAMIIALLTREAVYTILPASAVRPELLAGDLIEHPIVEPEITRRLFVIYSGDRSLAPPEREFVSLLKARLARPGGDGAPPSSEAAETFEDGS